MDHQGLPELTENYQGALKKMNPAKWLVLKRTQQDSLGLKLFSEPISPPNGTKGLTGAQKAHRGSIKIVGAQTVSKQKLLLQKCWV